MKKILFAILLLSGVAQAQTKVYAPNRNTGNVIVTDVAFRASEFMQLPYANSSSPSIGSYPDSSGRIFYNRLDSTIIIRNAGTWLKFFNSVKINAMDALTVHLAGAETISGAKTFNGNVISAGTTTVGNDIIWSNNAGYGLKGFDGVRFHSYTTAGGVVIGTTATPISLKSLTTAGVVLSTSAGLISTSTAPSFSQLKLSALNTAPSSASDTGTLGEIRIDANYIYICTATNTWKRVAIATW